MEESQIKSKTVMIYSSRKIYFVRRQFFKICLLSQFIVYWIHFQNIHTFTYQKILLHTLLLLVSKIDEISRFGSFLGRLSQMKFWNSEKLSNFKVHKLSWTVNELCSYLIIDEKISSKIYKISKKLAKLNSY